MQIKCLSCYKKIYSWKDSKVYYCCDPCIPEKPLCQRCRNQKKSCKQCRKRKPSLSNFKIVSYKRIEEISRKKENQALKTQEKKDQKNRINKQTKQIQIQNTSSLEKCFYCERNFNQMKINFYQHFKCKKKYCFPCLWIIYHSHKQNLKGQKNKGLKSERLQFPCCKYLEGTLLSYEKIFKSDACIFFGIHNQKKQFMFNIDDQFRFCIDCYKTEYSKEDKSNNKGFSVKMLLQKIDKSLPKECLHCQKKIKISDCKNQIDITAFNRKLCLDCFNSHGTRYQCTIDLLRNWKPDRTVSNRCKNEDDINYYKCSQPQCCKQIFISFQTLNGKDVKLDLIEWRDNKIYCGICLYFKYENKRAQFIYKKQKEICSQTQITEFQANKLSYQNFFSDKCMICLTSPTKMNPQKLLVNEHNSYYTTDPQEQRFSCQYCQKCLNILLIQKIKDIQLTKIRQEMFLRDYELKDFFKKIKNNNKKQFLLEQQSKIKREQKKKEFIQFWPLRGEQNVNQNSFVNKSTTADQTITEESQKDSKLLQPDFQADNEKINSKQVHKVSQKMKTNSLVQPLNIQIILSVELKDFCNREQQSSVNRHGIANDDNNENIHEKYLKQIQTLLVSPQMVKKISNISYEEVYNKFMLYNIENEIIYNDEQGQNSSKDRIKGLSKLNSIDVKSRKSKSTDNKCKSFKCRSNQKGITRQLLNLGMLCDNCFIAYLMGLCDLNEQIGEEIQPAFKVSRIVDEDTQQKRAMIQKKRK